MGIRRAPASSVSTPPSGAAPRRAPATTTTASQHEKTTASAQGTPAPTDMFAADNKQRHSQAAALGKPAFVGDKGAFAQKQAIPLDDILDFLNSPDGQPHVQALRERMQSQGAELTTSATHPMLTGMPSDRFEAKVTEFLYGSFLTKKEVNAAIPQGVAYAFAHIVNERGHVEKEGIDKIFPTSATLFEAVANKLKEAPAADGGLPTARRKLKYRWLPNSVVDVVAKSRVDDGIKARMPVLAEVSRLVGQKDALKGRDSIAVQHLFPSTRWLYEALADNGLEKDKTVVIGKPYSTDQDTYRSMRQTGWNVSWMSEMTLHTSNGTFDDQGARLQQLFKDVDPKTTQKRFLLLDEGGKVLHALHEHFPEYAHLCVGVEHTDRGIQLLEGYELKCPVVNVARSPAKKRYESPMIGESVVASIDGSLRELGISITPKEATILGYGAVGQNVAQSLRRRGYTVHVYDADPRKMEQAKKDGMITGTREEMLAHGHLTVGATGRGCLTVEEYALLPKKAVLANAASGRHEFGLDAAYDVDAQVKTGDPHETFTSDGLRRTLLRGTETIIGDAAAIDEQFHRVLRDDQDPEVERIALNNGFVVNMQEDIPPEYIQLTRALILAGTLQAAAEKKPGLVELDAGIQDFIVSRVQKQLAQMGLSLENPDFRGIMDRS
jgi:S-adenosylhomocysteine hydrolase